MASSDAFEMPEGLRKEQRDKLWLFEMNWHLQLHILCRSYDSVRIWMQHRGCIR